MNRNWEDFAQAIILQAVDDYRKSRRRVRQKPDQKEAQAMIREVEQFFRSQWFRQLSDVDGSTILYNLRANLFRPPVAEISKEVRSVETSAGACGARAGTPAAVRVRNLTPQCGVAKIENAGVKQHDST